MESAIAVTLLKLPPCWMAEMAAIVLEERLLVVNEGLLLRHPVILSFTNSTFFIRDISRINDYHRVAHFDQIQSIVTIVTI